MKSESHYSGMYELLTTFSESSHGDLQQINTQLLNAFADYIQSHTKTQKDPAFNIKRFLSSIETNIPTDSATGNLEYMLQQTRSAFDNLFNSTGTSSYTVFKRKSFAEYYYKMLFELQRSHKTEMIDDLLKCIANVEYDNIPNIINIGLSKHIVGAADIAFLKCSPLVTALEDRIDYPRGLSTTLDRLNKGTAEDISINGGLTYNTRSNLFLSDGSSVTSSEMNVICAGRKLITPQGDEEQFTENELIAFMTQLSSKPMMAMKYPIGNRIFNWLQSLYDKKSQQIDFDKDMYYHSRNRKKDAAPYTCDLMLKAPHGIPGAGRYNHPGQSHYYFASTQKGAENEVSKYKKDEEVTQTVRLIPDRTICLLDLSGAIKQCNTFLRYIRFPLDSLTDKAPREYLIPCFVADCCQEIGFDGIKYKGSTEYDNYVTWTDGYFKDGGMC